MRPPAGTALHSRVAAGKIGRLVDRTRGRGSGQSQSTERGQIDRSKDRRGEDHIAAQWRDAWGSVASLAANEPMTRSTRAFCQGEREAVTTSVIPIAST